MLMPAVEARLTARGLAAMAAGMYTPQVASIRTTVGMHVVLLMGHSFLPPLLLMHIFSCKVRGHHL
jgi:hypothetical protein